MKRSVVTFVKTNLLRTGLLIGIAVGSCLRAEGQSWILTSAPVSNWVSVASSADGHQLVAAAGGLPFSGMSGSIYISADFGNTWTPTAAPLKTWAAVASSANGQELIGADSEGPIYISTNAGATWVSNAQSPSIIGNWKSIGCSADGNTIIAGSAWLAGEAYGGQISISTNGATSWDTTLAPAYLDCVALAADGRSMLVGVEGANPLPAIMSTNAGLEWYSVGVGAVYTAALSVDGTRILVNNGRSNPDKPVFISENLGVTWVQVTNPIINGTSVAISADGKTMMAASSAFLPNGQNPIFVSRDSGITWMSNSFENLNWSSVASSADGSTLVAVANGGGIYTWHAPQVVPGTVLWTYDAGATISSSAAIAPDGSLVFGTVTGLVAITNASGGASNKWTFAVSNSISSSPAIALDGTVYFLNAGVGCYALNPDGTLKWSFPFQTTGLSSPAVGADGTVYVVGDGSVYAITSTGAKKWATSISSQDGSPVLSPEGTIYVATGLAGGFVALNPDGSTKWSISGGADGTGQSAAIGANGTVYFGNAAGLAAFNPAGNLLWYSGGGSSQGFGYSSPVIAKDGTIYMVETATLNLYAFNSSGQANLTFVPGSGWKFAQVTVPAIDAHGLIYYYGATSVYAVTPQGQVQWMVPVGGGVLGNVTLTSPVIGGDGTIYVGVSTELFAIAGTNALGDTAWPMFRQNARHTGKVERPFLALPQKRPDSNFTFQLYPNQLGLTYTVEASTNLSSWTTVTNIVATTLPTQVTDLSASNAPTRFYRAAFSPQ